MTAARTPEEVLASTLAEEGGLPGSSIHGWRCEYPDHYGPCDCLAETAKVMAQALRDAGLLVTPEHDREVAAGALYGAYDRLSAIAANRGWTGREAAAWLITRAQRIERGQDA